MPPLSVLAVLAMVTLIWAGGRARSAGLWPAMLHHRAILTHLLFFPLLIALGVFLPASIVNGRPSAPNLVGKAAVTAIMYASFLSCGYWVWKLKGFRWFAAGLMTLMEVLVFGAGLIAGMSVSGDWL